MLFQSVVEQVVMRRLKPTALRDDTLEKYIEQKECENGRVYGTGMLSQRDHPPTPKQFTHRLQSAKREYS